MKLKFNIKKDFRKFKEGVSYEFDFSDRDIIFIVGPNASGKSTLLHALRVNKNSFKETNLMIDNYLIGIKESIEVEGLENFEKVFYLDSVIDDPINLGNASDAFSFIELGGYGQMNLSNGQKTLSTIGRFLENIKDKIVRDKTLIVLDEFDKGVDIDKQLKTVNILKTFVSLGAKVLIVSHYILSWLGSAKDVFDIVDNKFYEAPEYFKKITGYSIILEKVSSIER